MRIFRAQHNSSLPLFVVVLSVAALIAVPSISRVTAVESRAEVDPEITIIGDNPLVIPAGETFEDPGATAVDAEDGELTVADTAEEFEALNPGEYVVSYAAADSDNNVSMAHRTVLVQDPQTYYGLPTAVTRISQNRVKMIYTRGTTKKITLPVNQAKKLKLTTKRDGVTFTSKSKKTLFIASPYTGEVMSRKKIRATHNPLYVMTIADIRPRADRSDEVFVTTYNKKTGTLRMSALTVGHTSHTLQKRNSVHEALDTAPQKIRVKRKNNRLTVKDENGNTLMQATYTKKRTLKKS